MPMLAEKKVNVNIGIGIGMVLMVGARTLVAQDMPVPGILLWLVAEGFCIWGCVSYCQGKGQPPFLGLVGVLACAGLLVLVLLPDNYPDGVRRRKRRRQYEDDDDFED